MPEATMAARCAPNSGAMSKIGCVMPIARPAIGVSASAQRAGLARRDVRRPREREERDRLAERARERRTRGRSRRSRRTGPGAASRRSARTARRRRAAPRGRSATSTSRCSRSRLRAQTPSTSSASSTDSSADLRGADRQRRSMPDREDELRRGDLAEQAREQRHRRGTRRKPSRNEPATQPQRARDRVPRRAGRARLDERQQQRDAEHRDDVVERDVPQRAARDGAFGLQLGGDEQHDGGRRRDADRRGDRGLERRRCRARCSSANIARERQRALGEAHRQQPAVVARPFEVEAAAEVEHDRARARCRRRRAICASVASSSQSEHAGPEQEARDDVAGDRRQHARGGREAAAERGRRAAAGRTARSCWRGRPGGRKSAVIERRVGAGCRNGSAMMPRRRRCGPHRARSLSDVRESRRPRAHGRIFSPAMPSRLRSGLTRSSRDTPSHITSDAMTSADE